jgi:hypothetical protein
MQKSNRWWHNQLQVEYIFMTAAANQAIWLNKLLTDLKAHQLSFIVTTSLPFLLFKIWFNMGKPSTSM